MTSIEFLDINGFTDKDSKEATSYIDVKSEPLREILREVLWAVRAISLMEDKPSVSVIRIIFKKRH